MGGIATKEVEDDLWTSGDHTAKYKKTSVEKKSNSSSSPSTRRKESLPNLKSIEIGDPDAEEHPTTDGLLESENYDPKTAGPIFPNGEINWECPCLGGAAHGPCGTEFRQAFSCFHYRYMTHD